MKKLKFICPCGLHLEILNRFDAIELVRFHVKKHHKDIMPFGVTRIEAAALLTEERS